MSTAQDMGEASWTNMPDIPLSQNLVFQAGSGFEHEAQGAANPMYGDGYPNSLEGFQAQHLSNLPNDRFLAAQALGSNWSSNQFGWAELAPGYTQSGREWEAAATNPGLFNQNPGQQSMIAGGNFQNYPVGQLNAFGNGSFVRSAPNSSFARLSERPSMGGTSFETIPFSDETPQQGYADDVVIYHPYTEAAPVSVNDADNTRQDNLPTVTSPPEGFVLVRGRQTRMQQDAGIPPEDERNEHEQAHVRQFECPVCHRGFKKKRDMQRHSKTHQDPEIFRCTEANCNREFKNRPDNLLRHLSTKHNRSVVSNRRHGRRRVHAT